MERRDLVIRRELRVERDSLKCPLQFVSTSVRWYFIIILYYIILFEFFVLALKGKTHIHLYYLQLVAEVQIQISTLNIGLKAE